MTLKECYNALEGDYEDVLKRLMSEKLVQKFVLRFLSDSSFESLVNDLKNGNYDDAFRDAHTLKGVCQNLGFTKLYLSSDKITEALRGKNIDEANSLLPLVEADYGMTISAIKDLSAM